MEFEGMSQGDDYWTFQMIYVNHYYVDSSRDFYFKVSTFLMNIESDYKTIQVFKALPSSEVVNSLTTFLAFSKAVLVFPLSSVSS